MIQQQAALKREMEPSRLGNVLSDTTTRRVIIGILLMLMVLPILTYSGVDYTTEFGLRQLFWFGRSNCNQVSGDFYCQNQSDWINLQKQRRRTAFGTRLGIKNMHLAKASRKTLHFGGMFVQQIA